MTDLRTSWQRCIDNAPANHLGPRVEPRWPNRWRAWFDSIEGRDSIDGWGRSEAEALDTLWAQLVARHRTPPPPLERD